MKTILNDQEFIDFKKNLININYFKLSFIYTVLYFTSILVVNTLLFKTELYTVQFTGITAIVCGILFSFVSKKSLPKEIEKNLKNTVPTQLANETHEFFTPSTYIFSKSVVSRGYLLIGKDTINFVSLKNKFGCKKFPLIIGPDIVLSTGNTKTDFVTRFVSIRPIVYLIIEQNQKKFHFQVHDPDKVIALIQSSINQKKNLNNL